MTVRVAEGIAGVLAASGTGALFGVPASETMAIVVAAERQGIATYHARHEQAAVGMADGYGRFSGRPGVVVVGRGPGFTNGLNAIITAVKARSPVVVVTGELPRPYQGERAGDHIFHSKNVDQAGIAELAGCLTVAVTRPEQACAEARRAIELASTGRVVVLLVPTDVAAADLPAPPSAAPLAVPVHRALAPDPTSIVAVADLLGESWACRRPLVLAGRGASSPAAREALVELGDRIGAVMVTTLGAKDLFAGNPADGRILGTLSPAATSGLAMRSDLALVFGASLNPFTTYGGDLLAKAKVVQFDDDRRAFGRHLPADLEVMGDAATSAQLLVDELRRRGHREEGYRLPAVLDELAAGRHPRPAPGGGLDGPAALRALDAVLPAERVVVVDAGAHMPLAATWLRVPRPDCFLTTAVEYTSVGSAFGIAAGAAIADPSVTTVLVIGDGGLAMALPDLQTLARYRLPVAVVVVNDSAFGQEVQLLQLAGLPDDIARYPAIDFEDVAGAVGVSGMTVRAPGDLARVPEALAHGLPLVIDCKVPSETLGEHTALVTRLGR
ncbi:MAG: thiamine pyrophosphate-binding protein [Acidimicrobiales bacterium]